MRVSLMLAVADPPSLNVSLRPFLNATKLPAVEYNTSTPLPNWTWDSDAHTMALEARGGATRIGIAAVGRQQDLGRGRLRYDLVVSATSDLYAAGEDPMLAAYSAAELALYNGGYDSLSAGESQSRQKIV